MGNQIGLTYDFEVLCQPALAILTQHLSSSIGASVGIAGGLCGVRRMHPHLMHAIKFMKKTYSGCVAAYKGELAGFKEVVVVEAVAASRYGKYSRSAEGGRRAQEVCQPKTWSTSAKTGSPCAWLAHGPAHGRHNCARTHARTHARARHSCTRAQRPAWHARNGALVFARLPIIFAQ